MITKNQADSAYYLQLLEKNNINPNFWCSEEYFRKASFVLKDYENLYWIIDCKNPIKSNKKISIFPPIINPDKFESSLLNCYDDHHINNPYFPDEIWSDFEGYKPNLFFNDKTSKFLDYEYIYNPEEFLNLSGKKWAVFRKNIRKWYLEWTALSYRRVKETDNIEALLIEWLKSDPERIVEDYEVFTKYYLYGENRKILIHKETNEILAINIWDENYKYINFRYCICKPLPFLSEYARARFYTDHEILDKNKLVNDGGSLGRESLEKFKDKLNPKQKRKVYSWE